MSLSVVTGAVLGLVVGARHALEPDHLAAVSTLVADRPRPGQAALLGALWGLGHTAALVGLGGVLLVAGAELPGRLALGLELVVAVMLIVLGLRNLVRARRDGAAGPVTSHHHRGRHHVHAGPPAHVHVGATAMAVRPLVVGVIHGLAGSGGLTALALAALPGPGGALGKVALFGLGSVAGMAAVSTVAGASLGRLMATPRAQRRLIAATGALSVVTGLIWGCPLVIALAA